MPSDLLYISPFVRTRSVGGRQVYYCADPAVTASEQRAVVRTDAVDRIMAAFREGANPEAVAVGSDAVRDTRATIEELRTLGFLRLWSEHREPEPSIELEVTGLCNADCVMCPRDQLRAQGQMTEEVFEGVLGLVARHARRGVIIQGIGEPTLHRSLAAWVRRLREAMPQAPVIVVTNGIRMDGQLYAELIDAGVTKVQWSMHSLDLGIAEEVFRTPQIGRAFTNIEECLRINPDRLQVNFVLMDNTQDELSHVRAWLAERGLDARMVRVIPVFSRGGTVDTSMLFSKIHRPAQAPCVYVRKSIFVAWNGDVLPCSNDIEGAHPYAHVLENGPAEIVRRWQEQLASSNVAFEMCRQCDHHSRDSVGTAWLQARHAAIGAPAREDA